MRAAVVAVLLAGCGRIGFGASSDGGSGDGGGGDGADAQPGRLMPTLDGRLLAVDPEQGAQAGFSVSFTGDGARLAVGAPGRHGGGAVYIFGRGAAGWEVDYIVNAPAQDVGDLFGDQVALSADGSTLAVSAPNEASAATGIDGNQGDNSAPNAGAVYVFRFTGADWPLQAYVKASDTAASAAFGTALAIAGDGDTLVAGSTNHGNGAGAAYVFERTGTTWTQAALLEAGNVEANDAFGTAVAIAGDGATIAVGAPDEDSATGDPADNGTTQSGAVYVFERAGTWQQRAYVKASNPDFGDYFGTAIALSADGTTLAASAPGEDGAARGVDGPQTEGGPETGAVYVYRRGGSVWTQDSYVKAPNADAQDQLGTALALSANGSLLIASASREDSAAAGIDGDAANNAMSNAGAVYVYERPGTAWEATHYLKSAMPAAESQFGGALAVTAVGDAIAIGAPAEDASTGAAYVIE